MRTRVCGLAVVLALTAGAMTGCGKSPTAPSNSQSADQAGVTNTMSAEPTLIDDGLYTATTMPPLSSVQQNPNNFSAQALIHPLDYWRTFSSISSAYTFAFSDTDSTGHPQWVLVTIHRHLLGNFNILQSIPADSTHPDSSHVIHKPMDEMWTRNLLIRRFAQDSAHVEWRLAGVSGVKITQSGAATQIQSIRVQSMISGVDTTVTDPTRLFYLRSILRFAPNDSVTVTATTLRTDDVVVLHSHDHRWRMKNNGDGTYTIGWNTSSWSGWRHFGVNAFSHGTLYDDVAPYDSQTWFLPYAITTDIPVDYAP
jgi:hypothetical protein